MLLCLLLVSLCLSANAHPKRVKDGLSEKDHAAGHEHNADYDHEAFLGKDVAKDYDKLTPEESKEKLGKLFHKVDGQVTADGLVTEEELKIWMQFTQNRFIREDSEKQMKQNDQNKDGFVSWEEYKKATYGFLEGESEKREHYTEMLARDERRFKLADKGADLKLGLDEFGAFLHPEHHDHMKAIVVNETLQDIDKDKDGLISLDEYIGDLWPEEDKIKMKGKEPEWVVNERKEFTDTRDINKDGKMDANEIRDWILPEDYDHVTSEAKHLVTESDLNKDGYISKEEMIGKFDLFVGSQATDFGEIFKTKEEL